jgi:hypoxanthine phosphoribosyltransferase
MNSKSWDEIKDRINQLDLSNDRFDLIVAIANGGIIPAALLQQRLQIPIELLKINFRDPTQKPIYDQPKLLKVVDFTIKDKRILLVEDRVKTGASLNFAKSLLQEAQYIKTIAVNGVADYSIFNESCFKFPWNL